MSGKLPQFSGFRCVWVFVIFDLPVGEASDKKEYVRFRTFLLEEAFMMLQYSVYARCYASEDAAKPVKKKIKSKLPPAGKVRVFSITDKQFEKMECYSSKKRAKGEDKPSQLALF